MRQFFLAMRSGFRHDAFSVTALRSVDLDTPDVAMSEAFYSFVRGLNLVTRHGGSYLRASGTDHHVVALHQGDRPALRAITFRLNADRDVELREIVRKLSSEVARAISSPEVQERGPNLGFDVRIGDAVTPVAPSSFLDIEMASIGKGIQDRGVLPE